MHVRFEKYLTVYVIKDIRIKGLVVDCVIEVTPAKFRSLKFRHTFYEAGDFFISLEEALNYYACELAEAGSNFAPQDKKPQ